MFFQPGLRDSTEWALHYRAPGLFDELRATGVQSLRWSTSTLDNPSTPGIGEVTFYFDFLGIEDGATVGQERQTGDMKEDRLPGGARYTWHNFVPGRHEWTLRMPTHTRLPPPSPSRPPFSPGGDHPPFEPRPRDRPSAFLPTKVTASAPRLECVGDSYV